jgi:zinc transporter ZupT
MAFAIAGILTILTLLFAMLQAVAAGAGVCDGDTQRESSGAMQTLCFGLTLAVMIAASHWLAWPW